MTLGEVIAWCDRVKPNQFTNADKTMWINEVESIVQMDVLLLKERHLRVYDFADDRDTELLASPPYDKIYRAYLVAKIDEANGEYNKYANTYQTYNNAIGEYQRYIARVYNPAEHPLMLIEERESIVRGTTASVQFELPEIPEDVYVYFFQDVSGTQTAVLSFDKADDQVEIDGSICTVTLTQADSLVLSAGVARLAVIMTTADGRRMETEERPVIRVRETANDAVIGENG